ncbi:MAG: glycosyltransferase family 4 protein [Janthinobacterium lividum]
MKVLIYIHSLENGGAERVVANLANHWATSGWEITVVTVAAKATDFYALDPAIRRIALDLPGGAPNVAAGGMRTVRRVLALRRCLRALRPDVALAAMHTANVVLALAAGGQAGLVAVGSEHNYPPKSPMGTVLETLRRFAYARLRAVVALTGECAGWLEANTRAHLVPVIPNPVSWPLPQQLPCLDPVACCRPGRRILLGAGRFSEEKNFPALVDAFERLAPRHPEWDLVILGDGPVRAGLLDRACAAGLEERVFLPGRVGNMGDWYAHADLYAMTSLFEGFPNTLVEAMACGLPAVSVDCDTGPRDIIRHGIDGLLVTQGDQQALQQTLDGLMGDAARRSAFGRRAVEVRQRFSIDKVSGMWVDLFQQLGGRNGTGMAIRQAPARACSPASRHYADN